MPERKLGDYIHNLRIKKATSLRCAAKEMDISAMYLSEIECGKKIPSAMILKTLSKYYQVDYFLLVNLATESSELDENSSKITVARMVEGLPEEKIKQVISFIQNIKGENK